MNQIKLPPMDFYQIIAAIEKDQSLQTQAQSISSIIFSHNSKVLFGKKDCNEVQLLVNKMEDFKAALNKAGIIKDISNEDIYNRIIRPLRVKSTK